MVLFLSCFLFACKSHRAQIPLDENALPRKVDNALDARIMKIPESLRKKGIDVTTMGQDYMIAIPSKTIFPPESPQLTWGSYAVLNEIACYLKQFRKIDMYITAYSGKYRSNRRQESLTDARARTIGNYLWSQGVDTRFIFTRGRGSDKPIVSFFNKGDDSINSRIEITFRDAVA